MIQFTLGTLYGAYLTHALRSGDSTLTGILIVFMLIVANYSHFCGRQFERERYD
jgi:hypothetical protein